jgi:thymidylate synthase (FAD)
MGTDLTVVNAARVSFDKESEWDYNTWEDVQKGSDDPYGGPRYYTDKALSERDQKLIKYLATHNHTTPFTHPQIQVRETVPIFVARQRFKHVVGFTYNEISRRYVDDEPEFYVPDAWRKRAEDKKQGSSDEVIEWFDFGQEKFKVSELYKDHISDSFDLYDCLIKGGVSPEQARMILPQSMMTSYYCTGSLAAFARAYKLRSYPDAQKEIRDLAEQWDVIIRPLFPHSWSALVD